MSVLLRIVCSNRKYGYIQVFHGMVLRTEHSLLIQHWASLLQLMDRNGNYRCKWLCPSINTFNPVKLWFSWWLPDPASQKKLWFSLYNLECFYDTDLWLARWHWGWEDTLCVCKQGLAFCFVRFHWPIRWWRSSLASSCQGPPMAARSCQSEGTLVWLLVQPRTLLWFWSVVSKVTLRAWMHFMCVQARTSFPFCQISLAYKPEKIPSC
jgi:hypothetical protein